VTGSTYRDVWQQVLKPSSTHQQERLMKPAKSHYLKVPLWSGNMYKPSVFRFSVSRATCCHNRSLQGDNTLHERRRTWLQNSRTCNRMLRYNIMYKPVPVHFIIAYSRSWMSKQCFVLTCCFCIVNADFVLMWIWEVELEFITECEQVYIHPQGT
jgi:hypothetical protein